MNTQSSNEVSKRINPVIVQVLLSARQKEQRDLAVGIGVSPQHMTNILKGTREANGHIPAIAEFFKVPATAICLETAEEKISVRALRRKIKSALLTLTATPEE